VSKRAEIGLGDLIRAVEVLAPNDVAMARKLARILQVGEDGVEGAELPIDGDEKLQDEVLRAIPRGRQPPPVMWSSAPAPLPKLVAPVDHATRDEHAWVQKPRRADSLPAYDVASTLPAPSSGSAAPKPALSPALSLFQPRWTRSLLTAAMATEQADGDVDLDQLVKALAGRVALRELPRQRRRTMRLGAQVLVERGDAMLPFRRDVAQILQRIRAICGEVTVLSFRGDPDRVYRHSPRHVTAHIAPRAGTPVVAIGDLGVGDPIVTTASRWLGWAQRLHHRDCPVVIITPIARGAWPAALLRTATIIPWDRATTSSAVHRWRARRRAG